MQMELQTTKQKTSILRSVKRGKKIYQVWLDTTKFDAKQQRQRSNCRNYR